MFNLDQAISEWRRQMLAAGITTPAPLEELEIHLRDEIERQTKSGLNEAEAFKAAVEKIGQADQLRKEFKKVEKNHKIPRPVLLIIGWLAAGFTLQCCVVMWYVDWDLFHFSPDWNLGLICAMLGILVALTVIWFLAKASRDKFSCAVSLLVCAHMPCYAIGDVYPEELCDFMRGRPSPLWFRGGLTLLLCAPSIFWVGWTWRHLAQKRNPTHGNQPILSD